MAVADLNPSLLEQFARPISRLRYRTGVLTGVALILLATFCFYGISGLENFDLPVSDVGFASIPQNHNTSEWANLHHGHLIPPKIWQIILPKSPRHDLVNDPGKLKHTTTWLAMNQDYTYTLVGQTGGRNFIQRHFGHDPRILSTYDSLPNVGMRSDFLRYLLLDIEGGVYTDTDTVALKPINEWVPPRSRNQTRLIVGIEFDQRDGPFWADISHPVQFCQWTIAAAPGHPVFRRMAARVMRSHEILAQKYGVPDYKPTSFEVMNSTGPAAWTDVVWEYLRETEPEQAGLTDIRNLSAMAEPGLPRVYGGDVLVLPIDGFGMGQPHSGSTDDGSVPDEALAKHLFGGSWREE